VRAARRREPERQYTYEEAARLLSVSVNTVRDYVRLGRRTQGKDGLWPILDINWRTKRIPASTLVAFQKQHTT